MKKLCALVLAVCAAPATANESPWRLGIATGYGERSNPLIQSDDIPIVVDLDIAWFGERFFFDNGDLGFTFADNRWLTASLVARFNSDRVFFGRTDTRFVEFSLADGAPLAAAVPVEPPDRDYAVEAGFELLADGDWGRLQVSAHHDVSGTHDGFEFDVEYGYGFAGKRWYLEPSIGFSYKNATMNDYYWGVSDNEANEALPAYTADAGVNARGRLAFSYYLSKQWALTVATEYERINDEAAESPIVEQSSVLGYFAGIRYRF